ncbi:hypothetical protein CCHR01_08569 [Colletotrichum chrysophilum]|uniref:BTB domain-containing protein n=1 Tax=Colletotrichum chrysophilum TaxID=1836956 RepID=A0AAD9EEY6_9PEZI|nr:hypothetical protein CCHR01_08569 [Colletotrichum chrysophilum]
MDEWSSTQNEKIAAKAEDDTEDCPMTKLADEMSIASLFLAPLTFTFKKSILIKDSEYFAACFKNENFIEGKTLIVEFDDIDPDLLGIYLHLASMHAIKKFVKFDPGLMKEPKRLKPMVDLYKIADRFMNTKMTKLVGCSILEIAMDHPIKNVTYDMTAQERSWSIKNYKDAFEALDYGDHAREYMRAKLVAAYCRWVPLGNFRDDLVVLENSPDFVRELTICFASLLTDVDTSWTSQRERVRAKYPPGNCSKSWDMDNGVLDMGDWIKWRPFPLITPKSRYHCGDKTFVFNKAILTQHSEFFATGLKDATAAECEANTITFNDIEPEHLDAYLQFVYCRSVSDRFQSKALCTALGAQIAKLGYDREYSNQNDREWWVNNVKAAFEAFDEHADSQVKLRGQVVKQFILDFPSEHLHSVVGLADLSPAFIRELWKALSAHAFDTENQLRDTKTRAQNHHQRIMTLERDIQDWRKRIGELEDQVAELEEDRDY